MTRSTAATLAGDVIEVTCSGNSITVKKNGTTIATATEIQWNDQTKCGLIATATSTAGRYDDVSRVAA
jgi:hypothetical protein